MFVIVTSHDHESTRIFSDSTLIPPDLDRFHPAYLHKRGDRAMTMAVAASSQ